MQANVARARCVNGECYIPNPNPVYLEKLCKNLGSRRWRSATGRDDHSIILYACKPRSRRMRKCLHCSNKVTMSIEGLVGGNRSLQLPNVRSCHHASHLYAHLTRTRTHGRQQRAHTTMRRMTIVSHPSPQPQDVVASSQTP